MMVVSGPAAVVGADKEADVRVTLYEPGTDAVGRRIPSLIRKSKFEPTDKAWDLLSIALSVVAADLRVPRTQSADGWTRQITLKIGVGDPDFWNSQETSLTRMIRFLTTDVWGISFFKDERLPFGAKKDTNHEQDSVVLLSGGLDSLVGVIDLVRGSKLRPFAVSQKSAGESRAQLRFANEIGLDLAHLQFNQLQNFPGQKERSQRARSMAFLAYGVLVGTALSKPGSDVDIPLYVCENGFISLNPPLTDMRLGSLSTRTTHPVFLEMFQQVLVSAGIQVRLINPYQFQTKGEMLRSCSDPITLSENAHVSISCGRFARHGYTHCGRCLPCLIRRAAFFSSPIPDITPYHYNDLSRRGRFHAGYDDVRSAAMAVATSVDLGSIEWARSVLDPFSAEDLMPYIEVAARGIDELRTLLEAQGVV